MMAPDIEKILRERTTSTMNIFLPDETEIISRTHPLMVLDSEPAINVMNIDTFRNRVSKIFQIVSDTLSKSYGPYGSSTIISDYPFKHVTKDGFSIMKKLSFSKDKTIIDDAIKGLIEGPCARLNYAVGDGTTTSIIAVNEIYQRYDEEFCNNPEYNKYAPRDILKAYIKVRDEIIKALDNEIEFVDTKNHDKMVETITKIANISSNADEEITNLIHDLYDELNYPLIEIKKSLDGVTKKVVTRGYHFKSVLKDGMYVNNDAMTGEYSDVDVLIFDHKVTMETFDKIIFPLNESCRQLQRNLLIIAPSYDEVAMIEVSRVLRGEFQASRKINLILSGGSMSGGIARNLCEDLAMLLNTTIINMGYERELISLLKDGVDILELFDISNRNIKGINVPIFVEKEGKQAWTVDTGNIVDSLRLIKNHEKGLRVGFVSNVVLGMNPEVGSVFNGFHYNEEMYNKSIMMLEKKLEELNKKSEAISSYNFEARDIQTRLFNLKMNIGTIEVGGESGLSQDLLYDAVDDTVKATASAYHNGVVKGCSTSTLRAIKSVKLSDENRPELESILLHFIEKGFRSVYDCLLNSRYEYFEFDEIPLLVESGWNNSSTSITTKQIMIIHSIMCEKWNWNVGLLSFTEYFCKMMKDGMSLPSNSFDLIINLSITLNLPFDLTKGDFNEDIINSAKTDKEVLLASSDLISLLITGNQFILADHS